MFLPAFTFGMPSVRAVPDCPGTLLPGGRLFMPLLTAFGRESSASTSLRWQCHCTA